MTENHHWTSMGPKISSPVIRPWHPSHIIHKLTSDTDEGYDMQEKTVRNFWMSEVWVWEEMVKQKRSKIRTVSTIRRGSKVVFSSDQVQNNVGTAVIFLSITHIPISQKSGVMQGMFYGHKVRMNDLNYNSSLLYISWNLLLSLSHRLPGQDKVLNCISDHQHIYLHLNEIGVFSIF